MSEAIHASAVMLYKVGALDNATMCDLDARHPAVPAAIEPARVKLLPETNNVSQSSSHAASTPKKARQALLYRT